VHPRFRRFPPVFPKKRLELKSLKGQTKAEELRENLVENLLMKTPYKFKKSYGGTPEAQNAQEAPWLHGPSLKTVATIQLVWCFPISAVFYQKRLSNGSS
jgi:hypothetical protein